ncbi:MAG: hypothetical protein ACE5EH_07780 [Gammaproteobacteria bacterium]
MFVILSSNVTYVLFIRFIRVIPYIRGNAMRTTTDTDKVLFAKDLGHVLLRYANTEYDGKLGCYKPKSVVSMSRYVAFPRKKGAIEYARSYHWPLSLVDRLRNRFGLAWGIRHDLRDEYFLTEVIS